MHYFNGELIPAEKWVWVAKYSDGSSLKQFDDDGVFHQMREVDTDLLSSWCITDGHRTISIDMSDGKTPVHFYRRSVSHQVGSDEKTVSTTYGFGFKYDDNSFTYMIHDNDEVFLIDENNTVIEYGDVEKFSD